MLNDKEIKDIFNSLDNEKKTEFILYLQKLSALQKAQEDMRVHPLEIPA